MAEIKSFTDLNQAKVLSKILPLESADMCYEVGEDLDGYITKTIYTPLMHTPYNNDYLPCWSLAALLRLIPNFNMFKRTIECRIETINHLIDEACDPVDAAFEMVCWLKENNEL